MHRRPVLVLLLVGLLLAACGKAAMSSEQATQVAVDAFAAAGLDADVGEITEDATVDRAIDGAFIQVHQVELVVDGTAYLAGVNRKEGAVVRLIEPTDSRLTEDQVESIASYRDNPAEDDARRRRIATWIVLLAAASCGVYLFFRSARRKAELAGDPADALIPLD